MCGGIASDGSDTGAEKLFQGWLLAPRSHVTKTPKTRTFCWAWKILSHARLKYVRPQVPHFWVEHVGKSFIMSIIEQLGSGSHFLKVVFRALSSLRNGTSLSRNPIPKRAFSEVVAPRWWWNPSCEDWKSQPMGCGPWVVVGSRLMVRKNANFSYPSSRGLIQKAEKLRHKRDSC